MLPIRKPDTIPTLCSNSRSVPSSFKRYVRKKPLVQVRGVRCVSAAVPTTRVSSPFRADHGTKAIEKAASLSSRWITLIVSFCNSGGQFFGLECSKFKCPSQPFADLLSEYTKPRCPQALWVAQTVQEIARAYPCPPSHSGIPEYSSLQPSEIGREKQVAPCPAAEFQRLVQNTIDGRTQLRRSIGKMGAKQFCVACTRVVSLSGSICLPAWGVGISYRKPVSCSVQIMVRGRMRSVGTISTKKVFGMLVLNERSGPKISS